MPILNDSAPELRETFTVSVQSVDSGSVGAVNNVGVGTIIDNDAELTVTIVPTDLSESAGPAATVVTIERNTDTSLPLDIALVSSDTTEADIFGLVTIPIGQTSVDVPLDAIDDLLVDGNQNVVITATALDHLSGSDVIAILDDDVPELTITIASAAINETDGLAATTATVSRNTDTTAALDVTLMSDDTGEAMVIGMVTIPAGQLTSAAFDIDAVDDAMVDGTQTVTITGSAVGHVAGTATVDVLDDETPTVSLSVAPSDISETGGTTDVTATLSFAALTDVTVNLLVTGTATGGGVDYDLSATQITILAGDLTGFETITSVNDNVDEVDETVVVDVDTVAGAVPAGVQQVTVTIQDDDDAPTVSVTAIDPAIVENGGVAEFTVQLSAISTVPITVDLGTGGTAVGGGQDYDTSSLQLEFAPGVTVGSVFVTAVEDALFETDETVLIGVIGATNATVIGTPQASTIITDNDSQPTVRLSVDVDSIREDFDHAVFTASLSAPAGLDVVVDIAALDPSPLLGAIGGDVDYSLSTSQITIPAGSLSGTTFLTAVRDGLDEYTETVLLEISNVTNAMENGDQRATTDIIDTDIEPVVTLSVDQNSISENLGVAVFSATLDAVSAKEVTVELQLRGAATSGVDYNNTPLTLTIPAGSQSGTVTVTVTAVEDDPNDEFDELVILEFVSVTNAVENIVQQSSTLILDDDVAPTVVLTASKLSLQEDVIDFTTVTATLSIESGKDIEVNLGLTGTATGGGVDYTDSGTQILIPAGQRSGSINIASVADSLDEDDETVVIVVSGAVNAVPETVPGNIMTTYASTDVPIPIPDQATSLSMLTIGDAGTIADLNVQLDITHGADSDLIATLVTPDGTRVELFNSIGSGDPNFSGTVLDDEAAIGIAAGITPFTGSFQPQNPLASLDGKPVAGIWTLEIQDTSIGLQGVLNSWSLEINRATQVPVPPLTVTILDDDAMPTVDLAVDNSSIVENGGTATFTATLSEVSGRDITVDLGITGAATDAADFVATGTQIVISAGSLSGSVDVTAVQDLLDEFDEDVVVDITSADFANVGTFQATTTILDDDLLPTLSIGVDNGTIVENGGVAIFTVSLSEVSGRDVTVDLSLAGLAIGGGVDFSSPLPVVLIAAGAQAAVFTVTANDDTLDEFDENVTVNLDSADFASVVPMTLATTFILDDDALPDVGLSVDLVTIAEAAGSAVFTAKLSTESGRDVILDLTTAGTATNGTDYISPPTQITIPAGDLTAFITVTAIQDPWVEPGGETVSVAIQNVANATADGFVPETTIVDDDVPTLMLMITPGVVNEADGSAAATATLSRNTDTTGSLFVSLTSSDAGEATIQANVAIPIGQTSVTVPINAVNDLVLDGTQVVTITAVAGGFIDGTDTLDVE
ncbi:MAG: Calx-beta domain-containing protein, partial [Fuerstiella sp.]